MSAARIEVVAPLEARQAFLRESIANAPRAGIPAIPEALRHELEDAQLRHLCASWIVDEDMFPLSVVEGDRRALGHLISSKGPGSLHVDVSEQIEFMHAVSGLPRALCAAWCYQDFLNMVRQDLIGVGNGQSDLIELIAQEHAIALSFVERSDPEVQR